MSAHFLRQLVLSIRFLFQVATKVKFFEEILKIQFVYHFPGSGG